MDQVFAFKLVSDNDEIGQVYNFVKGFPLDYPHYLDWLEKCRRELESGYKKAFCAIDSTGRIAGSLIFQPHKKDSSVLELKNLRVAPGYEKHGIGAQLVVAAESYAKCHGFRKVQGDAHLDTPVLAFMLKRGYLVEGKESLYTTSLEAIISKEV
jgi:GNAT superfamily N-acetyltransferase